MKKGLKKKGLNKGLGSLLGDDVLKDVLEEKSSQTIKTVALDKLTPNAFQPRKTFDESAIQTLADSIRQHGIIQPLAVRPSSANDRFEIIAGERRFRAAQLAELKEVPVVIHDIDDNNSAAFALIENLQREDLNVIEKSQGICVLIKKFRLTHEACGKVLGMSRSAVSNSLRLLDLSEAVQEALASQSIDMGHARALLPLEKAEQYNVLQQITLRGLSVRETESLVRELQEENNPPVKRKRKTPAVKQLETRLSEHLQTKVNISQQSAGNGKITLAFSDAEMLEKLAKKLGIDQS